MGQLVGLPFLVSDRTSIVPPLRIHIVHPDISLIRSQPSDLALNILEGDKTVVPESLLKQVLVVRRRDETETGVVSLRDGRTGADDFRGDERFARETAEDSVQVLDRDV